MAPEQFRGEPHRASDQYSLAVVAYEWLCGTRPFKGNDYLALGYQHVHDPPPSLRGLAPSLPGAVEQVVLKSLAKDPKDRHESIQAFAAALERAARPAEPPETKKQGPMEDHTHRHAGRYAEARAAYAQALQVDLYVWTEEGLAPVALVAYEQALQVNPNDASAWHGKGNALYALKEYAEALTAYERALQVKPSYAYAWNGKGAALCALKEYAEALVAYERALQMKPNFALAWYGKGTTLRALKRPEEALVAYERALQLDPNYAYTWNGKGNVLNDLKRYQESLPCYERAIAYDPKNGLFWVNQGHTLKRMGRTAEAAQAYQRARELGYSW